MTLDAAFPEFLTDFETKVRQLRSKKLVDFYQVSECVESIKSKINTVIAAKQCGLTKAPELKRLACVFSDEEYCQTVIELLSRELPMLDVDMYAEEGQYFLMADIMGMNSWSEEQVYDLVNEPHGFGQDAGLTAFLELINYGIDDDEPWAKCADYFHWPILSHYTVEYAGEFNRTRLKRLLKRKGAPPELYTVVMLTFFPPGDNYFLSVTADDWECDPDCMNFEITTENVRYLRKMWKQAQPLLEQIEPARDWIVENPQFIPILGDILVSCREET